MAPIPRGWIAAFSDWWFARSAGFPPALSSYTTERLQITLEDGVTLATDLYQPVGVKPAGTMLIRSPYGISPTVALGHARMFASRGYQVVLNACRGTDASTGNLEPGRNEGADGHAVVEWLRKQAWYTGSFCMIGGSYLGLTQWALLRDPPADMKAAVIITGPHDMSAFTWGTGAMYSNIVTWADLTSAMRRATGSFGMISLMLHIRSQKTRLRAVIDSVPLLESVDKYFEGHPPEWLRRILTDPERSSPYWKSFNYSTALDRANIPILLITGWYDIILTDIIWQYSKLQERGCNVALTIGPWTHLGCQGPNTPGLGLPWLEEHYTHRSTEPRPAPVRIYVTGADEWRNLPKWPPPSSPHELFLHPGKKLSKDAPPADAPDSTFKFDPADPTPEIGAPQMFARAKGDLEVNTAFAERSDVLLFTSEPLERDLEVCGKPSIEINHSTNPQYADLLVVLSEVDSTGTSRSISEKYLRLDPDRGSDPLQLVLSDCAHNFRKGNKVRIVVAGGSHPRYVRNLGSGENPGTGSTLRPVWHTVQHKASALSKVVLPVTRAVDGLD